MDKYKYQRHKKKTYKMRKLFNDEKRQLNPYHIFWTKTITEGFDNGFFEHLFKEGVIKITCGIKVKSL